MLDRHAALAGVGLAYALKDVCYATWGSDPTQAIGAAAALATLTERTDDAEVQALAEWTAGIAAITEGRMELAIARLDDAAARFETLGRPHTAASTQVSKLIALATLGRYDEAIACGLHARDVFLQHGDELAAGKIEQNLGMMYWRRDCYAEAEQFHRSAHGRFVLAGDPAMLVMAENGLANALASQHKFDAAARIYEQALARAKTAGLEVRQAEIECNLGNLALSQGRYDRALDYLERSRRRYATLSMPHESAYAEQELAEAYLELNLIPEAADIYGRVITTFAELGMQHEQARASTYYGQACHLLGRNTEARLLLHKAHPLFTAEGNAVYKSLVTLFESQLAYSEGDYAVAAAAAAQAEAPFAQADATGRLLLARWLRGESLRALGRADEARQILEDTLRGAEHQTLSQIAQRCHTSLDLLAARAGDRWRAEEEFGRAVAIVEELRAPLPAEEFRTAFVADKLTPYAELVRLCLDDWPQRAADALDYVERGRSRALVEMLGGAVQTLARPRDEFEAELFARLDELREELNWFYNQINRPLQSDVARSAVAMEPLQAAVHEREATILEITRQIQQRGGKTPEQIDPLDLSQLQADLGADTALVEYFSLDDEIIAFVITHERIEVVRDLGSEEQVEAAVSQLRFQTDTLRHGAEQMRTHLPQLTRRAQHYLSRLYDLLIRPLTARLGERRLVVVPHRALHYVPFQALYDGERYLIEQREVCYAPSASVLHRCLSRPPGQLRRALLLGVPDERAPQVRDEVIAVAPLFPESITLLDERATANELRRYAPTVDVLHLACHGQFRPDNPLFSSLHLGDGWFTVRDAYGLDLNGELVVLSACETGVNAVAPGDELIGLARGFFAAGAPVLLVSLWTVDDTTTARLMADFYTRLRAGERPAAALRAAQRALLADHAHPFFWSPFVLLGRW